MDRRPRPTDAGLLQGICGLLLAYNAVCYLMHDAALSVDIDPRKPSFTHAVPLLRETAPLVRADAQGQDGPVATRAF